MSEQPLNVENLQRSVRRWKVAALISWTLLAMIVALGVGWGLAVWQEVQLSRDAQLKASTLEDDLVSKSELHLLEMQKVLQEYKRKWEAAQHELDRLQRQNPGLLFQGSKRENRRAYGEHSVTREELLEFRQLFR